MKVRLSTIVGISLIVLSLASLSQAVVPKALCVPWTVDDATRPHSTYSGAVHTLKGVARLGATEYYWDYGDGTAPMSWTPISNPYNLGVTHTYNGAVNQQFIATLHVRNGDGTHQDTYPIIILESTDLRNNDHLDVRIDMAIDQGLWYLHTTMNRGTYSAGAPGYGQPYGYWSNSYPQAAAGAAVDAFQLHGSKVNNDDDSDPYVETVQRGLNYLLRYAYTVNIGLQAAGNPDTNGNGIGLVPVNNNVYQDGIVAVAIASSGAPNKKADLGQANVYQKTYKEIVQDMVDFFAWGQVDAIHGAYRGGWRYSANYGSSDMSTTQWPVLAMASAEQNMGCTVPAFVRTELPYFLNYAQYTGLNSYNGGYGYSSSTSYRNNTKTGAGIICQEFLGTDLTDQKVESALGYIYRHWNDSGGSWDSTRLHGNSYGMYAVMKAFRTPDPDIEDVNEYDYAASPPAQTGNKFSWYYWPTGQAQQGLAHYCVVTQQADGQWDDVIGSNRVYDAFSTGWRILVLLEGVHIIPPTAVICDCDIEYNLNEDIPLDGTCSYHKDSKRNIVKYEWDLDNDGVYDVSGPTATIAGGFPGPAAYHPVTLRVTDDNPANMGGPQTSTHTCQIFVHPPCLNPRADAAGPYQGFVGVAVTLDASGTSDPDTATLTYEWDLDNDGQFDDAVGQTVQHTWNSPYTGAIGLKVTDSCPPGVDQTNWDGEDFDYTTVEIGNHDPVSDPGGPYAVPPSGTITLDGTGSYDIDPGDSIVSYAWDLDNDGLYDDAVGQTPSFTAGPTPGTVYPICLKVTDSFGETDVACTSITVVEQCVDNLAARPKDNKIQLTWSHQAGVESYNVYRSLTTGGPYALKANVVTTYCTYLDGDGIVLGTTYYYVVRPVSGGNEICQSNEASATPAARRRR